MQPIVSAIGAPTYDFAKWLTKKSSNLPTAEGCFSCEKFYRHSIDFIERIEDVTQQEMKF